MDKYEITSEALFDLMRSDSTRGSIRISEYNYALCTVSNSGKCYELNTDVENFSLDATEDIEKEDKELFDIGEKGERDELRGERRFFLISKKAIIQLIQKGMYSDGDILIEVDDD